MILAYPTYLARNIVASIRLLSLNDMLVATAHSGQHLPLAVQHTGWAQKRSLQLPHKDHSLVPFIKGTLCEARAGFARPLFRKT